MREALKALMDDIRNNTIEEIEGELILLEKSNTDKNFYELLLDIRGLLKEMRV